MAFETLDIKIKAESGDAESALESVRDSLADTDAEVETFDSSLNDAEESTDDLKGSSAALSATLAALNSSASGAQDSVEELGDSAIGATASVATLGGSITALEAALVPLAAVLAPVAAGLSAVAGAAGLVVGSGLLAFGEELAANNQRRLEQINSRIGRLNALKNTEAGLTAQQQETLTTLEDRQKAVEEQTSATGALAAELDELKTAFADAFSDAGEQFVPLVRDGLNALPPLIQDLGDAFENADLSNVTGLLRDIGGAINQNAVGAFETFLELANDTAGGLRRIAENEAVSSFVSDLASGAGDLGSALGEISGDVIDFLESDDADAIFQAINEQVEDLAPDLVELSENVADVFDTLERNPGAVTATVNAVGVSVNALVDALNLVIPILEPVIRELGNAGEAFNDLDADVQTLVTLFTGPFGIASVAVIDALAGIIPSVDDVKSAFNNLKDDASAAIGGIRTAVSNEVQPITNKFNSITTKAKNALSYLTGTGSGSSLAGDIESTMKSFFNDVKGKVTPLKNKFGKIKSKAKSKLSYLTGTGSGSSLAGDIESTMKSFFNDVKGKVTPLKNKFGKIKSKAKTKLSYLTGTGSGSSLAGDIESTMKSFFNDVKGKVTPLKNKFGKIKSKAKTKLSYLTGTGSGASLSGDIKSQLSSVKTTAVNKKSKIKTAFGDIASAATSKFDYLTGNGGENSSSLKSDITGTLTSIATKVENLAPELNFAFDEVVTKIQTAFDSGIDISDITNTIDSLASTAVDALETINSLNTINLNGAISAVENFLAEVNNSLDALEQLRISFEESGGENGEQFEPVTGAPDLETGYGEDRPAPDPGTDDGEGFVGAATGGVVESTGGAVLHEGERVVPAAQVADRGPAPIKNDGVTVNINNLSASSRAEGRQAARGLKDELKRFDI